jgi:hypothetical protein
MWLKDADDQTKVGLLAEAPGEPYGAGPSNGISQEPDDITSGVVPVADSGKLYVE